MARLDNATPFAATLMPSCDREGRDLLLLVAAAHFHVPAPGSHVDELQRAAEQAPPPMADVYLGEPGRSSLQEEGQSAYTRCATDIYVHGHAVAPQGEPVRRMPVGIRVGPCMLLMQVHGDRVWERAYGRGAVPSEARRFARMPLTWERAYGGASTLFNDRAAAFEPRNPVGCGFETDAAAAVDRPVPNIEDPKAPICRLADRPVPVGVGPVARHWQPRAGQGGTYDRPIEFHLPKVPLRLSQQFCGLPSQHAVPVLDGVRIDTDSMRLTLFYRAALPVSQALVRHTGLSLLRLRQPWEASA